MTVSEILSKLRSLLAEGQELSLQSNSFIAGGAVANLLFSTKHNSQLKINDIDVFQFVLSEQSSYKNLDGAIPDYLALTRGVFKFVKTERFGIINVTTIGTDFLYDPKEMIRDFIEGFDINSTKAGIYLNFGKEELYTSDDFDEFMETKQLKAVNVKTPIKTMMRLIRKRDEMQAYVSKSHLHALYQFAQTKKTAIVEENFYKFKKQREELSSFFEFNKQDNGLYSCKHLLPFDEIHKNEKKLIRSGYDRFMITPLEWKANGDKRYEKYSRLILYRKALQSFLPNLEAAIKNDFNPQDVEVLEKIYRLIPSTTVFAGLDVRDAVKTALEISRFESHEDIYLDFLGSLEQDSQGNIEFQFKQIELKYIRQSEPLVKPLEIPDNLKGVVEEMISVAQIRALGRKQKHCVGGYGNKIKRGQSRIFKITTPAEISTLELSVQSTPYRGVQHRTTLNKFPNELNRHLAILLIISLNKGLEVTEPMLADSSLEF